MIVENNSQVIWNLLFDDGALPSTVDLAALNRNRVIPLLWITAIRILPANPSMGSIKFEFYISGNNTTKV